MSNYRNSQTPEGRVRAKTQAQMKVRRRYKKNTLLSRKLLPGEIEHVDDMVIVLRLAGYSQRQIAQTVGLSQTQVDQILDKPHVTDKLIEIRAALPKAALELLQGFMIEAVQSIVDVMRTSQDDKLVLQAAGEILDRSGLAKASRQERTQITENRTVFTDEGIIEKLRSASPEVQEQAAQAIEALENLLTNAGEKAASE